MNRKHLQFDLRTLFAVFVILGIILGIAALAYRIGGPVLPTYQLRRIQETRATREEVRAIFGSPQDASDDGRAWIYERPSNPGWVEIYFDQAGRVCDVNDESP